MHLVVTFNEILTNSLAICSLTFIPLALKIFIEHEKKPRRVCPMKSVQICLNSIDKVKSFVNDISKFDCDFDLVSGRYVIDAKSIMGIFSLDLSKPIEFNIHANDGAEEVLATLQPYLV